MKTKKEKLSLKKLTVSKLKKIDSIVGGALVPMDDGTQTRTLDDCKTVSVIR